VEKGLYALSESGRFAIGDSEKRSSPTPEHKAA
jgi:hypothetical protein